MKATVLWIAGALCLVGCRHTWERRQGPTREQKLELYTTTASYLYEDDDLYRAQEQAVKALEIDSDDEAMRRMIGWIRLRLNGTEDLIIAERFFRDLVRDGDENPATVLGLAIACERLGLGYDRAARDLAEGRRAPTEGRDADDELAELRKKADRYWDEATRRLEGLLEVGEGNTDAMNALQRIAAARGQLEESLAWSERLVTRADEELATWRRLLTSKDLSNREEEVFRENEERAHDLILETRMFAATLYFKQRRDAEALGHVEAVLVEAPELTEAHGVRAQLLNRLGRHQEAIEALDRFLSLSDKPFEHPDIRRAFELREASARALASN